MSEWGTALIGAVSAILASASTAIISHRLEWRRRRIEENLRWLEERYRPALEFLAELVAELTGRHALDEADRIQLRWKVAEITRKAWPNALLLDPEDTGLRDILLGTLAYDRIAESEEEQLRYMVSVMERLRQLSSIFLEERNEILRGKSVKDLIRQRADRKRREEQLLDQLWRELEDYRDGKMPRDQMVQRIQRSGVRGELLRLLLEITESRTADEEARGRLRKLREVCVEKGWIGVEGRFP